MSNIIIFTEWRHKKWEVYNEASISQRQLHGARQWEKFEYLGSVKD